MKPKKTNKVEWSVTAALMWGPDLWGYEIRHNKTNEIRLITIDIKMKMLSLGIIDNSFSFALLRRYPTPDPFANVSDAFLDAYIDKRPSWNEYFMAMATLISQRSTCDRLYVGSVIVRDNHIIAQGYNGSIKGHFHCDEVGHLMYEGGCKRTIHAEKNALNMAAKLGISVEGADLYVTHYPCPDCMKEINQAGIKRVFYKHPYKHRYDNSFDHGLTLIQFKERDINITWEDESYEPHRVSETATV